MFFKKGALAKLVKFTGKHLCWSLYSIITARLQSKGSLKKRLQLNWFLSFLQNFKNTF